MRLKRARGDMFQLKANETKLEAESACAFYGNHRVGFPDYLRVFKRNSFKILLVLCQTKVR
ncbi:unnamed protein product [Dovyalis caffra]|uniref:Uncharacterized protein n=1 Tax=Dovyalis caffra TaxID=77055 RepID=A0AAV1RWG1_9ROSI|nr:unnamed protein product [Dovyalis caffra]